MAPTNPFAHVTASQAQNETCSWCACALYFAANPPKIRRAVMRRKLNAQQIDDRALRSKDANVLHYER
jgi:hypothetical protein